MRLLYVIVQITLVYNLGIKDNAEKVKSIFVRYASSRQNRCAKTDDRIDAFVESTVNFLVNNGRFEELLTNYDISECKGKNDSKYLGRHLSGLLLHDDVPDTHWQEYKSFFDKKYYSRNHEMASLAVWRDNLKVVAKHNREFLSGKRSFSLHLNNFGDWHVDDYVGQILRLIATIPRFDPARDFSRSGYNKIRHRRTPRAVDWRSRGFKPRREEQWHCGACYAFAVTHTLQGQLFKTHRRWVELRQACIEETELRNGIIIRIQWSDSNWGPDETATKLDVRSPQQIVDCSSADGNGGCSGGSLQGAFRYAARVGLAAETQYPYLGTEGRCHYSGLVRVRPRRWATLPAGNELALERALATIGPLAVAVNAAPITFQLYRSGIYDDPFCIPWKMNHAMLLVGYTPSYWILLNWWGRHWGEDGYIRIRRGFNTCGVANMATYAEL